MKKDVKNFLIGSSVAAGCIGVITAVSYTLTKKLVNMALDRKGPEILEKNLGKITGLDNQEGLIEEMTAAAERLENRETETVQITADDGTRLIGHWYACENPKRVIVAMHGWRSTWARDFGMIADFWHDNGCCVLYAEQRGQGDSGGDYMCFGLKERYDCFDWIRWVNERTGGRLPVYLGGISMGATTVLMTAGLELPENVKGIVADCGFTSPDAIWKHVVEHNFHLPYVGIRSAVVGDLCKRKIKMGANDYSSVDAMRVCKTPVLFIHGTDDHFVPVKMTYENYLACAAPKRLLVVPGADHGMSYRCDKELYEKTVKEFWNEFD